MQRRSIARALSLALLTALGWGSRAQAQNPIIQTIFTADPAPLVHDGVVYLYTGHDEDNAPDNRYLMRDYRCFTSTDMVNWTHHGPVLDIRKTFEWSAGDANAAHVVHRNGKFYYYVSTGNRTPGKGGVSLGVAVADKPTGPFKDALGKALVTNDQTTFARHGWDDLDPAVFIDADGRAFLYWGNNACYFAELNEDMISLKGEIRHVPFTQETIGPDFEEAPWLYRRNDLYYLLYASQIPETLRYSTSSNPLGPWTYRGLLMQRPRQRGLGTNHPGLIEFKNNAYLFYHSAALPGGGDKRRSVCVEQFSFNPDGTIPEIPYTDAGILKGVARLNPFNRTEAETIAWASGVETASIDPTGVCVTDISDGDYIRVRDVDFGERPSARFHASLAATAGDTAIELRLGSPTGELIGTLKVTPTGALDKWELQSTPVAGPKGVHDLYLKFTGGPGMNLDWWRFE